MAKGPYNPLDKQNLARSIKAEVLSRDVETLDTIEGIVGAGVYAIYYRGAFEPYAPMASANAQVWTVPIYVGKAIPKGGRKGGLSDASASSSALSARLRKHAESIKAAHDTLRVEDFGVCHIVLDDIWIPLGENILIESFKPLWNVAVEGFGINDPGKGRLNQKQSSWDILHPGRLYAAKLTGGGPERSSVLGRVEDYFAGRALRPLPRALAKIDEDAAEDDRGEV